MAAGFTVQNFSKHGETFLERMDNVSFPIYIAFFTIVGASINVDALKKGWVLGLIIVLSRIVMIHFGSYFSDVFRSNRQIDFVRVKCVSPDTADSFCSLLVEAL